MEISGIDRFNNILDQDFTDINKIRQCFQGLDLGNKYTENKQIVASNEFENTSKKLMNKFEIIMEYLNKDPITRIRSYKEVKHNSS